MGTASYLTFGSSIAHFPRWAETDSPPFQHRMIQTISSIRPIDTNRNAGQHSHARGTWGRRALFSGCESQHSCTGIVCSALVLWRWDRLCCLLWWRDLRATWYKVHGHQRLFWNHRLRNKLVAIRQEWGLGNGRWTTCWMLLFRCDWPVSCTSVPIRYGLEWSMYRRNCNTAELGLHLCNLWRERMV